MSEKKSIQQKITDTSKELSTGLTIWLLFLLSLVLLEYSVPLSILLGAIGGLAGSTVFNWWRGKDEPLQAEPKEEFDPDERLPQWNGTGSLRDAKNKKRSQRYLTSSSNFYKDK
ncbi:MAG: hypothetical protein F6K14_19155 [Symploca sp. SIO2C1]|nr:hypothetical protein [Symploca sp. SIO2C1]